VERRAGSGERKLNQNQVDSVRRSPNKNLPSLKLWRVMVETAEQKSNQLQHDIQSLAEIITWRPNKSEMIQRLPLTILEFHIVESLSLLSKELLTTF